MKTRKNKEDLPFLKYGSAGSGKKPMAKRKPKPATAGEKIADGYAFGIWHTRLSLRIDRAIARAVRKERERCVKIIGDKKNNPNTSWASAVDMSNIIMRIEER